MKRQIVATGLQVAGAGAVTAAAIGVSVLLGLLVGGVALVAFGLATELGGN